MSPHSRPHRCRERSLHVSAGWVLNELRDAVRDQLLAQMLEAGIGGARVLIVEPIATRVSPWWPDWEDQFVRAGGEAASWRISTQVPDFVTTRRRMLRGRD